MKQNTRHRISASSIEPTRSDFREPPSGLSLRVEDSRAAGFTLIELLVVIAIIGILAGIVYSAVSSSQERAKKVHTQTFIGQIDTSLSMFEESFGQPPQRTAGGNTNDPEDIRLWLTGLKDDGDPDVGPGGVRNNTLWSGPYIEPDPKMLGDYTNTDTGENYKNVMLDSWGHRIRFQLQNAGGPLNNDNPIFNIDRWDIWSWGPDEEGSEDMHDFQDSGKTYEERRIEYKMYNTGGKEVNRDNPGNY